MATDPFTDSNGTYLTPHDAKWINVTSGYGTDDAVINNNILEADGAWQGYGGLYNDGQPDDQLSQMTFVGDAGIAGAAYRKALARATKDSTFGYVAYFNAVSGGNYTSITILKNTTWASSASGLSYPVADDLTFKISATWQSTTTVEVIVDDVEKLSWADSSSPILSGLPGFKVDGPQYVLESRIDDWTDGIAAGAYISHTRAQAA